MNQTLDLASCEKSIQGRAFEYKNELFKCVSAKILKESRKLAITTTSRTIVLLETELNQIDIKGVKYEVELNKEQIRAKYINNVRGLYKIPSDFNDQNQRRPWIEQEDNLLKDYNKSLISLSACEISEMLQRKTAAVYQRAYVLKKAELESLRTKIAEYQS